MAPTNAATRNRDGAHAPPSELSTAANLVLKSQDVRARGAEPPKRLRRPLSVGGRCRSLPRGIDQRGGPQRDEVSGGRRHLELVGAPPLARDHAVARSSGQAQGAP